MFNSNKLEKLLREGDKESAKKMISDYLAEGKSDSDVAELYTTIAEVYLRVNNEINEQFLQDSNEVLDQLEELGKMQGNVQDAVDLANTRKSLEN